MGEGSGCDAVAFANSLPNLRSVMETSWLGYGVRVRGRGRGRPLRSVMETSWLGYGVGVRV